MYKQTKITNYINININKKNNKNDNNKNKNDNNKNNNDNNKNNENNENNILSDNKPVLNVYTDGSTLNNGKYNAVAGIGIYFGKDDIRNVSQKLNYKNPTNNIAELTAIKELYNIIKKDIETNTKIIIHSDSRYSILCLTTYGEKCENKKWEDNIPNKNLVKYTYNLYKNKNNVKFKHIKAHTNKNDIHSIGNSQADKLARNSIKF